MSRQLLILSQRLENVMFCQAVGLTSGLKKEQLATAAQLADALKRFPGSVVFWDLDDRDLVDPVSDVLLSCRVPPQRVFGVTGESLNDVPSSAMSRAGHLIFRHYRAPAPMLIATLIRSCIGPRLAGFSEYLGEAPRKRERFELARTRERPAVLGVMEEYLKEHGAMDRVATVGVQALDELLMNAIFDAPVSATGERYRKGISRQAQFDLAGNERVEVEVGITEYFIAVSVKDRFGSFAESTFLDFRRRDYRNQQYVADLTSAGAGLGISWIVDSGLSLIYNVDPSRSTQAILFIPLVNSVKLFRSCFRFAGFLEGPL